MADENTESVFRLKPAAVIEMLARQVVHEQIAIAKMRRLVAELPTDAPGTAETRAELAGFLDHWLTKGVPNTAASFRLALEVLDTYGPDRLDEKDAVEAAVWNNKFFVWRDEFTPL